MSASKWKKRKGHKKKPKQAPLRPPVLAPTGIAGEIPLKPKESLFWRLVKIVWKVFVALMAIIGFVATIQQFGPKISISPAMAVDEHNPFLTGFVVSNDGLLPIYKIRKRMLILEAEGMDGRAMQNINFQDNGEYPWLGPGRKTTIQVPRMTVEQVFRETHLEPIRSYSYAQMKLYISYRPMLSPFRREEPFLFWATTNMSGGIFWSPIE